MDNGFKKKSPFRDLVTGVDTKVPLHSGKLVTYINFDNAATTPPFKSVIDAINNFAPWYSSIHRGKGYKSRLSSQLYEEARQVIIDFVNADPDEQTVIFLKNTTEAINKISNRLLEDKNNESNQKVILSTEMEHHSNDLPWRDNFRVDYVNTNNRGDLSLEDLEAKLIKYQPDVRLVTVCGASNVTGYINPIHKIADLTHQYGAELLVDAAQLLPHYYIDMKKAYDPCHIDYLVFSAHKMYAPFGTGVLIGPKSTFRKGAPDYKGGGTVNVVTPDKVSWAEPPHKEEAGTPNLMGVVALVEAIRTLTKLKMKEIMKYENALRKYTIEKIKEIPDLILYSNDFKDKNNNKCNNKGSHKTNKDKTNDTSDRQTSEKVAIIPFNIRGLSHEIVATALAEEGGIAVRNGCFCAQPYVQKILGVSPEEIKLHFQNPEKPHPGLVRVSFGLYNTFQEVDKFIEILKKITENKNYYQNKYSSLP
jgi:selenocysteine lyase/cysteine desulfurase